jgi:hypothetical protein
MGTWVPSGLVCVILSDISMQGRAQLGWMDTQALYRMSDTLGDILMRRENNNA